MRSKLSYANVMATIAVFIALGGASYAAVTLPKNSVGAKQLKKNAVNSKKVKNKSLGVADLSAKAVSSLRGQQGEKGEKGEKGDKGDTGAAGSVATWTTATVETEESITTSQVLFDPFADLDTPGPAVTVTVPDSGLVEVYAEVTSTATANGVGGVGLAVDGTPGIVSCGAVPGLLIKTFAPGPTTYATSAPNGFGIATQCGAPLPGQPVALMLKTSPGEHTFKLVYTAASGGGSSTVDFADRRLSVAPRP